MKLIILRGLPGSGKSVIAGKLGEQLNKSVVSGDVFKLEFMKNNCDFKEACQLACAKVFEKIKELFNERNKIIIIEELFHNRDFFNKIKNFCEKNNIEIKSFYIKRDLDKLLEVEKNRERKIKNTKEDFEKLKKELDEIKIENEVIIDNNNGVEDSVKFILGKIV